MAHLRRVVFCAVTASVYGLPPGYVVVPSCDGCLMHESCVKSVRNGEIVNDSFDVSCGHDMLYPDEQVYAMDAHTDGSVTFTQMNSSWKVPALPKRRAHQTVFFWPGFKAQKPEPGYPVLQPVLQYGQRPGQTTWELQSWFVWAKRLFPVAVTGPAIKVSAGDQITSWMDFDQSSQMWTVYARNEANGQESILKVTKGKVGNQDFAYAMHVLETVMPASNYCDQYPPDDQIEFFGISANNGSGVNWIGRTGKTDCHQQVNVTSKGDDVKFTWQSDDRSFLV